MLVKNWMSQLVITLDVNNSMMDAAKKLKEHDIRMLPVMKKGKLVGIVTDRDLKRASASDVIALEIHELLFLLSRIKVERIMTKDPITVPPDFTVEETAEVLLENKISGVPVVDYQERVVGIITQTDLFKVLISLTGMGKRGLLFAFQVEDRPGSIKEAADIIRNYDGRMASILTAYEQAPEGYRNVYIRAYEIGREKALMLRKEMGEKTTLLYMVDHGENKRDIF